MFHQVTRGLNLPGPKEVSQTRARVPPTRASPTRSSRHMRIHSTKLKTAPDDLMHTTSGDEELIGLQCPVVPDPVVLIPAVRWLTSHHPPV